MNFCSIFTLLWKKTLTSLNPSSSIDTSIIDLSIVLWKSRSALIEQIIRTYNIYIDGSNEAFSTYEMCYRHHIPKRNYGAEIREVARWTFPSTQYLNAIRWSRETYRETIYYSDRKWEFPTSMFSRTTKRIVLMTELACNMVKAQRMAIVKRSYWAIICEKKPNSLINLS